MIPKLSFSTLLLAALFLSPATGQNVLSYFGDCGGHFNPTPGAVASIPGAMLTTTTTTASFNTTFDMGGWDVVVFEEYGNNISTAELDRLVTHAMGGGRVVFQYWAAMTDGFTASHPLFTTICPVTMASSFTTPPTLELWDPTSSLFMLPNPIT